MSKNPRPKIFLVYTGGTIGMEEVDGERRPPVHPRNFLGMAPELSDFVELDASYPLNKDSSNMNPQDWCTIADEIYSRRNHGYQGFVVAHGTDTMHFTAAALAFAFGPNLNFPIVVTGAQTTPQVVHGDARVNLLRACRTALEPIAEVVIAFGDYVFRGCRAQKKDERRFDAFESPAFPPIAYVTENIEIQPLVKLAIEEQPRQPIQYRPHFSDGILQVSLIPGLEPEFFMDEIARESCKGVILQSFGAGNVPDANAGRYSFEALIRHATNLGKPVIITSQFPGGSTLDSQYESHIVAVKAGAIPTGNMVSSAAAVKFRWVVARVDEEIRLGRVKPKDRFERIGIWMRRRYTGELGPMTNQFTDHDETDESLQIDEPEIAVPS